MTTKKQFIKLWEEKESTDIKSKLPFMFQSDCKVSLDDFSFEHTTKKLQPVGVEFAKQHFPDYIECTIPADNTLENNKILDIIDKLENNNNINMYSVQIIDSNLYILAYLECAGDITAFKIFNNDKKIYSFLTEQQND